VTQNYDLKKEDIFAAFHYAAQIVKKESLIYV